MSKSPTPMQFLAVIASLLIAVLRSSATELPPLIRSARSGAWSSTETWEGDTVPKTGARVQIRSGHVVVYDLHSDQPIRSVHIAGTLSFAPDKDTLLNVGLIKIQPGDDVREEGFDCEAHPSDLEPGKPRPALEVGKPGRPIDAGHKATIRLLLSSLLGFDPRRYRDTLDQKPAALSIVDFRDAATARLALFNDSSHYDRTGAAIPEVPEARLSKYWKRRSQR